MSVTLPPPLPESYISKDELNTRVKNYQETKLALLNAAMGDNKNDTKSIWYSKIHLEQLINEMNHLNASGMRIYLGAYPVTHNATPGQTCLLWVPTRATNNNGSSSHKDIISEDEPDFPDRIAELDKFKMTHKGFNFGSPCPPACGNPDDQAFPY